MPEHLKILAKAIAEMLVADAVKDCEDEVKQTGEIVMMGDVIPMADDYYQTFCDVLREDVSKALAKRS